MKHLTFPITEHVKTELQKHGVRRFRSVKVRKESYDNFLASIRQGGYTSLSDEQKHALAIGCCMTHPDHKDKHKRIPQYWYWVALVIGLMLLLGISARAQGTSQIDVITFQNSSGVNIKSFAAPFKIKCSTNITCAASGSTLTMTAAGGAGGSGYSIIQNAGVAIAAEGAINFLGVFSCTDNAGNASSDCKLSASAAVSHQFVTGTDSSGNYLRAQPAYSDISGTPTLAATLTNASHKWLNSYDSTTGLFTQTQPAYSDISGTPTLPATLANAAHKWFNSYDATTGLFTQTQPAYSDISGTPQLAVTKTCTGTDKVSAYDSTTGLFTCTTDQTGAGGSTPTGTGFTHITGGTQDAAAKTVDVSGSDITGVLASADFPALTGDVTNSAGSLATTIANSAVSRAKEAASGKGWEFIGTCTVNPAAATCPITFSGTARKHGQCEYYIAGYAGGGGIAMVNFNSDTGSNYNRTVGDNSAAPTQTNATTGIRVANTTTTNERFGRFEFFNVSAIKKFVVGHGTTLGAPTATGPNENNFSGWWTNVAGLATSIQLGNAGVNINANSTMTCWARDDD